MKAKNGNRLWLQLAVFVSGCLVVGWVLAKLWARNMGAEIGKLKVAVTEREGEVWRAVVDTRMNQLVWNTFVRTASVTEVFFPTGKVVMGFVQKSNRPPLFFVHFRDLEGTTNLLAGTHYYTWSPFAHFSSRHVRDATGKVVRRDVWYQEMWWELVVTNGRAGIVLKDKWFPITFDTNGYVRVLEDDHSESHAGIEDELEDFR